MGWTTPPPFDVSIEYVELPPTRLDRWRNRLADVIRAPRRRRAVPPVARLNLGTRDFDPSMIVTANDMALRVAGSRWNDTTSVTLFASGPEPSDRGYGAAMTLSG